VVEGSQTSLRATTRVVMAQAFLLPMVGTQRADGALR
jgi:hypothetical protein